jgi:hypothetical protein
MTITEMEHHQAMVAWLVFITPALLAISSCFMGIVARTKFRSVSKPNRTRAIIGEA